MSRKPMPGLRRRGAVWHIDKRVKGLPGGRLRESTGTDRLDEAEAYLVHRLEEIRNARVYGLRPRRTFEQAAAKYLLENTHKASILDDAMHLKQLMPYVGGLPLEHVHAGSLTPFIAARRASGIRTKSINNALAVVRRILNLLAADRCRHQGPRALAPSRNAAPQESGNEAQASWQHRQETRTAS